MSFKFRLEAVLDHTLSKEESKKQELAIANSQCERIFNEIEKLQKKIEEVESKPSNSRIEISVTLIQYNYIERIKGEIAQKQEMLEIAKKERQECELRLIEVLKERKVLDKLKEKHKREYLNYLLGLEQKFLDEQALIAFHKR